MPGAADRGGARGGNAAAHALLTRSVPEGLGANRSGGQAADPARPGLDAGLTADRGTSMSGATQGNAVVPTHACRRSQTRRVLMRRDDARIVMEQNAGADRSLHRRPPRLPLIFHAVDSPLYFVTFCTARRAELLAKDAVHSALRRYAEEGSRRGVAVGRYVIMPDPVHLFVRGGHELRLSYWVRGLRRAISAALRAEGVEGRVWQEGFFDHLLRNSESYAEKWHYVRENPVRKGLVTRSEDWLYAGEIVRIDRV